MAKLTFTLHQPTNPHWIETVCNDFDAFLIDHAACEKKASATAMTMIAHYPDKPKLVKAMLSLAIEELNHYKQVVQLIYARGLRLTADVKDPYIHKLHQLMDRGKPYYLCDRLLLASIIERRGQERFSLIAKHINDEQLKNFYCAIAASEKKHYALFIELACHYYSLQNIETRLHELLAKEAHILQTLEVRAALH